MNRYWAVIPAAGIGQRMNAPIPKQFMQLGKYRLIEWAIRALANHPRIEGIYVGLSSGSDYTDWVKTTHRKVLDVYDGGRSRTETVLNGIRHMLAGGCSTDDWLLVHDSNRPFVTTDEISELILEVGEDVNGGILCQPIFDTTKLAAEGRVSETLPRGNLFRAQTPQMFTLGMLIKALEGSLEAGVEITDESQAMERMGWHPRLVPGRASNIKITTAEDIKMAEAILDLNLRNN